MSGIQVNDCLYFIQFVNKLLMMNVPVLAHLPNRD